MWRLRSARQSANICNWPVLSGSTVRAGAGAYAPMAFHQLSSSAILMRNRSPSPVERCLLCPCAVISPTRLTTSPAAVALSRAGTPDAPSGVHSMPRRRQQRDSRPTGAKVSAHVGRPGSRSRSADRVLFAPALYEYATFGALSCGSCGPCVESDVVFPSNRPLSDGASPHVAVWCARATACASCTDWSGEVIAVLWVTISPLLDGGCKMGAGAAVWGRHGEGKPGTWHAEACASVRACKWMCRVRMYSSTQDCIQFRARCAQAPQGSVNVHENVSVRYRLWWSGVLDVCSI